MKLEKVALPSGLQSFTSGLVFDQSLAKVALPSGVQSLAFWRSLWSEHGEGGYTQRPAKLWCVLVSAHGFVERGSASLLAISPHRGLSVPRLRLLPYLGAGVVAAGNGSRSRIANLALRSPRHTACVLGVNYRDAS